MFEIFIIFFIFVLIFLTEKHQLRILLVDVIKIRAEKLRILKEYFKHI